jgi:hypothetical protein
MRVRRYLYLTMMIHFPPTNSSRSSSISVVGGVFKSVICRVASFLELLRCFFSVRLGVSGGNIFLSNSISTEPPLMVIGGSVGILFFRPFPALRPPFFVVFRADLRVAFWAAFWIAMSAVAPFELRLTPHLLPENSSSSCLRRYCTSGRAR